MVDQGILFRILLERALPLPILRFMLSWYRTQQMQVRWGDSLSEAFLVSNGVRQGSVLSPLLFAVYMDGLLAKLNNCGVGCHRGSLFAGAFCYADDIVLLAPCASALRTMLSICNNFAVSHGLHFNVKTQLICFRSITRNFVIPIKLGHILTSDLNDKQDIIRDIKQNMNRKTNFMYIQFF